MKQFFAACLLLATVSIPRAQQLQNSSLYDLQGAFHNPSLAGVAPLNSVGVSYRTQWSSIAGSPKTVTAFGSFKIPKNEIGVSGYVYKDETGPTSRSGVQLAFAKHIIFKNKANLSLGIETRFLQFTIDKNKLSQTLGNDPVLGGNSNNIKFDAGFGISYTTDKFQAGASVSQLTQSNLKFYTGNLSRTETAKLYRHYYLHGKYLIDIDGSTTLTPNALFTILPNAPVEFQGGVRVEHEKLVWAGFGYRVHQGPMFSAGVNIKEKFTLGYAFDIYNRPLPTSTDGSTAHEILLKYSWGGK